MFRHRTARSCSHHLLLRAHYLMIYLLSPVQTLPIIVIHHPLPGVCIAVLMRQLLLIMTWYLTPRAPLCCVCRSYITDHVDCLPFLCWYSNWNWLLGVLWCCGCASDTLNRFWFDVVLTATRKKRNSKFASPNMGTVGWLTWRDDEVDRIQYIHSSILMTGMLFICHMWVVDGY